MNVTAFAALLLLGLGILSCAVWLVSENRVLRMACAVIGFVAFTAAVVFSYQYQSHSVSWYQEHPAERASMNLWCITYPGQAMLTPNCQNAEAAKMHSEIERLFASMPK